MILGFRFKPLLELNKNLVYTLIHFKTQIQIRVLKKRCYFALELIRALRKVSILSKNLKITQFSGCMEVGKTLKNPFGLK